jgi:hypothetical protein
VGERGKVAWFVVGVAVRAWAVIAALGPGCGGAVLGGEESTGAGESSAGGTTGTSSGSEVPTSGGMGTESGSSTSDGSSSGSSSSSGETTEGTTGEVPAAGLRYDEVRQKSAHNSFQRDEALIDMMAVHRVRSLEFDIHVGDAAGEWFVYHTAVIDEDSQCRTLAQCLGQVAALHTVIPEHEVITLWVDLKDGFDGEHGPEELDAALMAAFGARLVTPGELIAGCAGATSVQSAVTTAGCAWPELAALRGRVLVALTGGGGDLDAYVGSDAGARAAFVAPGIASDELAGHPEAAIINLEFGDVGLAAVVGAAGLVSRVWTVDDEDAWEAAVAAGVHHLATNQVNAAEDPWSTTASAMGWPFVCIEAGCEAPVREAGAVLAVTVDSGDLWESEDSGVMVRWALAGEVAITGLMGAVSSHVEQYIKGCVGARAGTEAGAPYLAVCRPADEFPLRVQVRAVAGGDTEAFLMPEIAGLGVESPGFVRFERDADGMCARGLGSADGVAWVTIAERCFTAPLTEVGVMASSHAQGPARVLVFGLTAEPGGPLVAGDATVVPIGDGSGAVADGL